MQPPHFPGPSAHSLLGGSALKAKAAAWRVLQILLVSSELGGNIEVIISNPLISQIRDPNQAGHIVWLTLHPEHFREKAFLQLTGTTPVPYHHPVQHGE